MAQTISEAQGSYPSLYIDGDTVEAETMLEAERVQVEWGAVSSGYVMDGYRCSYCDEVFETREEFDAHLEPFAGGGGTDEYHRDAEPEHIAPLVNSAAIDWSGKTYDGVTVSISVGDPRGAFAMTVRRLDDGTMLLHTPYPGDSLPHMQLEEIHPGTYKIS